MKAKNGKYAETQKLRTVNKPDTVAIIKSQWLAWLGHSYAE